MPTPTPTPTPSRLPLLLLLVLFGASGAPGLVAQVAWTRAFAASLGHEGPALCGVVTAFFAGLGAGAWLLDGPVSRSRHPARWYAGLEGFSAAWIAVGTLLLPAVNEVALKWCGMESTSAARLGVAFLVPLVVAGPASAAMGATLAAVDRAVTPWMPDGRAVAGLYAVNTVGAVLGVLAAVGWLMPGIGLRGTLWAAAAIQALCAAVAWWAGRPVTLEAAVTRERPESPAAVKAPGPEGWRGTAFVAGLLGIGYELLGIRALSQTTENTIHSFAAVLAVFLLGTALGSAVCRWLGRRGREPSVGFLMAGLALGVLLEGIVMATSPALLAGWRRAAWPGWLGEVALAAAVFLMPTLLMGALYARVVQSARGERGGVGKAVAWNAFGGALAGPLFLVVGLPLAGWKLAVGLLAAGYGGWAIREASRGELLRPRMRSRAEAGPRTGWGPGRRVAAVGASFAVLAFGLGRVPSRLLDLPPGAVVTRFREGFLATVAVVRTADGNRTLRVNNHFQQGGTATAAAARRHAHLPLLLHPAPRRALFLGVGTGITLGAAAEHPGLEADGVELLPEVIAALPEFEPENGAPQRRPGFRIFVADARRFARVSTNRYDVVVADLFHPAEDGAGFLYTREHFAALRDRLAPGGLVCQWLPLHQLDGRGFADVGRTFRDVFPGATLWLLRFNVDVPVVGLVGRRESGEALTVDPAVLKRRIEEPRLAEALRPLAWTDPIRILGCLVADPATLERLVSRGDVATDDRPLVLFRAAAAVYRTAERPHARLMAILDQAGSGVAFDSLLPAGVEARAVTGRRLAAFGRARDLHLKGLAMEAEGHARDAAEWYARSAEESGEYTGGYAQAILVASAFAREDPAFARGLLERLRRIRPGEKLAEELLRRMESGR